MIGPYSLNILPAGHHQDVWNDIHAQVILYHDLAESLLVSECVW